MFLPEVTLVQYSRQHRNTRHQVEHGTYVYIRNSRPEARPSGEQQKTVGSRQPPDFPPHSYSRYFIQARRIVDWWDHKTPQYTIDSATTCFVSLTTSFPESCSHNISTKHSFARLIGRSSECAMPVIGGCWCPASIKPRKIWSQIDCGDASRHT